MDTLQNSSTASTPSSDHVAESNALLDQLGALETPELRRLLAHYLTQQKLGLYWEHNDIERDRALNDDLVFPRLDPSLCHGDAPWRNFIIEGDNFDALRLLKATHANRVRVIYIDPPYNTGNKDWVYNDRYVSEKDRYRHSLWLEFLYRRLWLARDLLAPDGVILVSINDENRAKLELLMDQVFQGMRIGSFVWRTKDTGNDAGANFSQVHEHILVYARSEFQFNGKTLNTTKYRNSDNDPSGPWAADPITCAKTLKERRNLYYPLQNPATGYWYPCDPNAVWRYATEKNLKPGSKLRRDTIEEFIRKGLIVFPSCKPEEVMRWDSKEALLAAIRSGQGPMLPKKKTPLLREDLPDLDFWVGKPIAPGRPSKKSYLNLKTKLVAPVSSWIAGLNEDVDYLYDSQEEELELLRSARGGEGTDVINAVLGAKAFNYPKPPSLLTALLRQATQRNDLVLDFFAGSGTMAQAVLTLNAEDGGDRQFILVSSTEAPPNDPDRKNLCRDVCAERVRRVMQGYRDQPGGGFAYLRLHRIAPADVRYELDAEQAWHTLCLRLTAAVQPWPNQRLNLISQNGESAWVLCPAVDETALSALQALPADKLVVYSDRPTTVAEALADGKTVDSQSWREAASTGQGGK